MNAGLPAALFVTDTLHPADIELPDGTVHRFLFREFTAAEYRSVQRLATSTDEDERDRHRALLVALTLCDDTGARVLASEQAERLRPVVRDRMYVAALQANGYGGTVQGNGSAAETPSGSGTSSPLPSAAGP